MAQSAHFFYQPVKIIMNEQNESSSALDPKEDASTTGNGTSGGTSTSSTVEEEFVKKETTRVFYLRLLVVAVLLSAAAAVSVVLYFVTSSGEDQEFESQYESAAQKVAEAFLSIASERMGSAAALVVALVAHGVDHSRDWPFVALSSFQQRSATAKRQSGAISISIHPIVWREDRLAWENYTRVDPDNLWYTQGLQYQRDLGLGDWDMQTQFLTDDPNLDIDSGIASHIYNFRRDDPTKIMISPLKPFYLPIWQTSPVSKQSLVNQNSASSSDGILTCLQEDAVVFEGMRYTDPGNQSSSNPTTAQMSWLLSLINGEETEYEGDIFTTVFFPLYNSFSAVRSTVGVMSIKIVWKEYFKQILPNHMKGIILVLEDGCDEPFTYRIDGEEVIPLGPGDLHDPQYDTFERSSSFVDIVEISDGTKAGLRMNHEKCPYQIRVYPSTTFYDQYNTNTPIVITCAVGVVFVFAVLMFVMYDRLVEKRQKLIMRKAKQTHQIVSSLFPKNVRDRILNEHEEDSGTPGFIGSKTRIKSFLDNGGDQVGDKVIADLYPSCTVFFADISGFTAWSSTREPSQVFILLQALYQAYDKIAARRKVFKVETIGDSYVAATGLPDPQPSHAVILSRFAAECMTKTTEIFRELEPQLGPGTGDLQVRMGLHSGPVTAGVLMGDRARFQLFGDTVNTASRMESTGKAGFIQVSQTTASLLMGAGKDHWLRPRADDVMAKGKGVLQTFWLTVGGRTATSNASSEERSKASSSQGTKVATNSQLAKNRLVDWMVELLVSAIRKIKVKHVAMNNKPTPLHIPETPKRASIDELVESFHLPSFDSDMAVKCSRDKTTVVDDKVKESLREYVQIIASAYRDNPFHNFEHACHVTMSASKFLSRVVSPEHDIEDKEDTKTEIASHIQNYTHGIYSDPVAMFAIVYAALIHDLDHQGISNEQLMKEQPHMASAFQNHSVAEQNSFWLGWKLLISDQFKVLREGIFASQEEFAHFRQVVVNVVLSTDIFDKEMTSLRMKRWDVAFSENAGGQEKINDMRATVVIESIVQASDVSHTMQHWHVYRKWNRCLFEELYVAYRQGRLGADPATFWYEGELKFFDKYIIPLARKLKECKVFGASSDECLDYATRNREEWQHYGEALVEEMMLETKEKYEIS